MKLTENKRLLLVIVVIAAWILMAVVGLIVTINFSNLAAYFLALTGFVGTYIFGESVRKSTTTHIFKKGQTSTREKIIYATTALWLLLGGFGIFQGISLVQLATYFASLTPFVSAYILGETYKPEAPQIADVKGMNVDSNKIADAKPKAVVGEEKPTEEIVKEPTVKKEDLPPDVDEEEGYI